MSKSNKWEDWWNSLSPQMQQYLKAQPVWHDRDLYRSFGVGVLVGFLIGVITVWH